MILFESAGNRDPLLARVQIELIRHLLANAGGDDTFVLLTAGTRLTRFADQPRPVTPANIKEAVRFLEGTHLIGALDLGLALEAARPFLDKARNPHLLHVGAAIPALGETRDDLNVKRMADGVRYVGVGVGKKWNRAFMKLAAERSGGYFTQVNPDEAVNWRAFELLATLNTPRLLDLQVSDETGSIKFLADAAALAQGEELCAVARLEGNAPWPATVRITGKIDGQPFTRQVPLKEIAAGAGYLPRAWAKLEIDRLLAEDALQHKQTIIELSKASYVMSPYTSLLVLETDADYAKYKVDRGRQDHWAMYPCPQRIPIVHEPDPRWAEAKPPAPGKKLTAEEVLQTILVRQPFESIYPNILVQVKETHTGSLMFGEGFNSDAGFASSLVLPLRKFSKVESMVINDGGRGTVDLAELLRRRIDPNDLRNITIHPTNLPAPAGFGNVDQGMPWQRFWFVPNPVSEGGDLRGHGLAGAFRPQSITAIRRFLPMEMRIQERNLSRIDLFEASSRMDQLLKATEYLARIKYRDTNPKQTFFAEVLEEKDMFLPSPSEPRSPWQDLLYERPTVTIDDSLFADLTLFAPGLNTTEADLKSVLEAEGETSSKKGTVDPAARHLIDKARQAGWQTLTLPGQKPREKLQLAFDGQGRYRYERTLESGLQETVLNDGQTLYHLYAEIGLGSRRPLNRFHRAAFTDVVPWALPPADDLAHGCDVKALDASTVTIVPLDAAKNSRHLHLVFAADGRLQERRVVEMPNGKILFRETYDAQGTVRFYQGERELVVQKEFALAAAHEPSLVPDVHKLVVLHLPLRTHPFWMPKDMPIWDRHRELALHDLARACFQGQQEEAIAQFTKNFQARGDRRLGLYTLLAAAGVRPGNKKDPYLARDPESVQPAEVVLEVASGRSGEPLAQYLDYHFKLGTNPLRGLNKIGGPKDGFLQRLAAFREMWERWESGRAMAGSNYQRGLERQRALQFILDCPSPLYAWAIVDLVPQKLQDKSAEFYRTFLDGPGRDLPPAGLGYVGRYEYAKSLLKNGQVERAKYLFQKLHAEALKLGAVPPLDHHLSLAMVHDGGSPAYEAFLRKAGLELARTRQALGLLALAYQAQKTLDSGLTDELLTLACSAAPDTDPGFDLAAISCMWHTRRLGRAEILLQQLLAKEPFARNADMWRLAARLAQERGQTGKVVACLDRALDLDFYQLPQLVNLEEVRQDYRALLEKQEALAAALGTLGVEPQKELVAGVIRNADRWRSLDPDNAAPCQLAARVLNVLGAKELAWDYLTTPIAQKPNEADPWLELARQLRDNDQFEMAEKAFAQAFAVEPTNAQILWDGADNLQRQGKTKQARQLYRQIAEGSWQPRFQLLQQQARQMLGK